MVRAMVRAKALHEAKGSKRSKGASARPVSSRRAPGEQLMAFLAPTVAQRQAEVDEVRIPITFDDYLTLVDWTGRALRHDKKGRIPEPLAPTLERLNINPTYWLDTVEQFESRFYGAAGALTRLKHWSQTFGRRWSRAQRSAQLVFT